MPVGERNSHTALHLYNFMDVYISQPSISLWSLKGLHVQVTGAFPSVTLRRIQTALFYYSY